MQDLIIFPGEVEFKRVSQCATGRVFLLKFLDRPDRKYFYWMQEPKETKDEEFQKKVRKYIFQIRVLITKFTFFNFYLIFFC